MNKFGVDESIFICKLNRLEMVRHQRLKSKMELLLTHFFGEETRGLIVAHRKCLKLALFIEIFYQFKILRTFRSFSEKNRTKSFYKKQKFDILSGIWSVVHDKLEGEGI